MSDDTQAPLRSLKQCTLRPTEIMLLRPHKKLSDLVISHTIKMTGNNYRSKIERLSETTNRWLSVVYPINRVDTNSAEARTRIMSRLAIICYIHDLETELNAEICFDFEKPMNSIDDYFEVTQCIPYIEEYPQLLKHKPVSYNPGINRNIATALVYPKQELIEKIALLTGLTMNIDTLKYIAQPVLMDGKQTQSTIDEKFQRDYQKFILHETIGTMIAITLMNSEQPFESPPLDTYMIWADQLIAQAAETPCFEVVINTSNNVFWIPDAANFW